ncbi:MAG: class I SAM-dependent methyltransferase, partial [Eubacteriales bacterium]
TGLFLEYMSGKLWEIEGIDISAEMVEKAVRNGFKAGVGDILSVSQKCYHFISLWDVIEHLLEPKESLAKINSLLEIDGDLIIQTPSRGLVADSYGPSWRHFIPPQHVHIFSQQGLFNLLITTGFRIVNWVSFGSGYTTGTTNPETKAVFDKVVKTLGIGDTVVVWAKKVGRR